MANTPNSSDSGDQNNRKEEIVREEKGDGYHLREKMTYEESGGRGGEDQANESSAEQNAPSTEEQSETPSTEEQVTVDTTENRTAIERIRALSAKASTEHISKMILDVRDNINAEIMKKNYLSSTERDILPGSLRTASFVENATKVEITGVAAEERIDELVAVIEKLKSISDSISERVESVIGEVVGAYEVRLTARPPSLKKSPTRALQDANAIDQLQEEGSRDEGSRTLIRLRALDVTKLNKKWVKKLLKDLRKNVNAILSENTNHNEQIQSAINESDSKNLWKKGKKADAPYKLIFKRGDKVETQKEQLINAMNTIHGVDVLRESVDKKVAEVVNRHPVVFDRKSQEELQKKRIAQIDKGIRTSVGGLAGSLTGGIAASLFAGPLVGGAVVATGTGLGLWAGSNSTKENYKKLWNKAIENVRKGWLFPWSDNFFGGFFRIGGGKFLKGK